MEAAKILAQRNKMRPAHHVQPSLKPRFMKEVKPPKKSEKEQKNISGTKEMSLKKTEVVKKAKS